MSASSGGIEEEIKDLRQRIEKLEASLAERGDEMIGEPRVDDLFRWQQRIPHIADYDFWSIMLAKKQGTNDLRSGIYSGGGDYAKVTDLSPEDAANLAGALSHPARVLILRECVRASQYPSDLEKRVSAKYGALYHHINSLTEAKLVTQEKERGKYTATPAGRTALMFLNVLASVIDSTETTPEKSAEK